MEEVVAMPEVSHPARGGQASAQARRPGSGARRPE